MRLLLSILCAFFLSACFAQQTYQISSTSYAGCGTSVFKVEWNYTLVIEVEKDLLKWKWAKDSFEEMVIKKRTNKYLIAESDGNYAFFDIKAEKFFKMVYSYKPANSYYIAFGFGKGKDSLVATAQRMLDMLKEGKSQRDVIFYLAKQADYDF